MAPKGFKRGPIDTSRLFACATSRIQTSLSSLTSTSMACRIASIRLFSEGVADSKNRFFSEVVGVGLLRAGKFLSQRFKVSEFQSFAFSHLQSFEVAKLQSFRDSKTNCQYHGFDIILYIRVYLYIYIYTYTPILIHITKITFMFLEYVHPYS